jgi:hypoxia up-regulated 1
MKKTGASMMALAVTALLFTALVGIAQAKLLALDMGSDTTKIALVKPGRNPITIVTNEMTKRKTPTKVAFNMGARLFGEAAAGIEQRHPQKVFSRVRDALGQTVEQGSGVLKSNFDRAYRPYDISEDSNGTALFAVEGGEKYSSEELTGMLLEYFADMGRQFAESETLISDMAIVIPSYYGMKERIALVNAGKYAGVNILGFINTASAAALHYAKDKDFVGNTEEVIFFNMGAAYSEASRIRFTAFKDAKTSQVITNIVVLDSAFNAEVGAETLDLRLTDHFADKYMEDKNVDLRKSGKSMAKLKKACKKAKEVLSANTGTPLNVESIHEDYDLRESISREEFEVLIEPEILKIIEPLQQLLQKPGVDVDALTGVELLGGGVRVPAIQKKLSEVLSGRHLDRHLDGDEAAVMGAALFAANYSKSFVLKKMRLYERFSYALEAELVTDSGTVKLPSLLEYKSLPAEIPIKVKNNRKEFQLNVAYAEGAAPPGVSSNSLCSFEVSGLGEIDQDKYDLAEEAVVHLKLDVLGTMSIEKAFMTGEYEEKYNETVKVDPPKKEEKTEEEKSDDDSEDKAEAEAEAGDEIEIEQSGEGKPEGEGEEVAAETEEKKEEEETVTEKTVEKVRKRKKYFDLKATWKNSADFLPSAESVKEKVIRLQKLTEADKQRYLTEEAKNKLESFILQTMTQCNEEEVEEVSSEEEREKIKTECMDAEDWLYSDGEQANLEDFTAKYHDLAKLFEPIEIRMFEKEERPEQVKKTFKKLEEYKATLKDWETKKPWVKPARLHNITARCDEVEAWLKEKVAEQSALKDREDPILRSAEIAAKLQPITKSIKITNKIPKPKPTKAEKEKADAEKAEADKAKAAESESESKDDKKEEGAKEEL